MKKSSLLCSVFALASTLLGSSLSLADYNSLAKDGPVTCTARGGSVTINSQRTSFTVTQAKSSSVFNVSGDADTDQDTYTSYTGQLQFDHQADEAVLTFSDQGDTIELGGKTSSLNCPE